jgi:serine/threonine protein kinase
MGEVYRARDTRLGRDVAVKVSVEQFNSRFEREARAIAALNHPPTAPPPFTVLLNWQSALKNK